MIKQAAFNRSSGSVPVANGTRTIGFNPFDPFFDDFQVFLGTDFPEEMERAVFSTTFFAHKQMKAEFPRFGKSLGAPSWLQKNRFFDRVGTRRKLQEKPFYGADSTRSQGLGRAFAYKKFKGQGKAVVGWLSNSAATSGRRWQEGGVTEVTQEHIDKLAEAKKLAEKSGAKWPYARPPRLGDLIIHKKGGKTANFFSHFFSKHEVVITNTLKRKIEEKMKFTPRGSSEVNIQADMNAIVNGVAVQAYNYSAAMVNAVLLRQLGSIA